MSDPTVQIQDIYEDVNITPTNPPYDTRSVTGPTLDPNRNKYFTPPALPDAKKRKASQDREYSTALGKKGSERPSREEGNNRLELFYPRRRSSGWPRL